MALQILPAVQKRPSFASQAGAALIGAGADIAEGYMQGQSTKKENAALKELTGMDFSGLTGENRKELSKIALQGKLRSQERADALKRNAPILRDMEKKYDLEEGALDAYAENLPLAKQVHEPKIPKKTQASQPIDPEQLDRIKTVKSMEGFEEALPSKKNEMLIENGVSKENAKAIVDPYIEQDKLKEKALSREQSGIERADKAHESFINDTTKSYKSFETDTKPRLLQMKNIPDEDLITPTKAVFLEALGIPLGALENPASELYQKLSQDLLKGLPETYGSRILKVEVDNFLKTIPTLLNSPEGRRMISSNMLKLGEMKEVYYNEMRRQQQDAIQNNKQLPRDFQQSVFDQVKPQIDRVNNEFMKLTEIKAVPKDTIPFFSPSGEIEFVPKEHAQWAQENGGRRIW
jgi:hypothetical protein